MASIRVIGARGGAGATTFAAACGIVFSRAGDTTITGLDDDMAAVLGIAGACGRVSPRLALWPADCAPELHALNVVYSGRRAPDDDIGADAPAVLVTRACYLSLRGIVRDDTYTPADYAGAVVVAEDGRSLGARDIESVLGVPVLGVVPWRASTARAIDAGVFATRLPDSYRRPVESVLARVCAGVTFPAEDGVA